MAKIKSRMDENEENVRYQKYCFFAFRMMSNLLQAIIQLSKLRRNDFPLPV